MAKKKKAAKPAEPEVTAGEGEEVESEEAHVEEATIKVRGTEVGGTCMMTPTEYEAHLKKIRKKK